MTKVENNKVIQTDFIKFVNERTWINPTTSLGRKMTHYQALFIHCRMDLLSDLPAWIPLQCDQQVRISYHHLEIKISICACKSMEEGICQFV